MAEGGVAPPPPKRPSVRPPPPRPLSAANAGSSVRIPARPAPPPPGSKPSSSLIVKAPQVTKNDAKENIPRKENGQTGSSAARKRPEITIVCARPMSEVGFRDQSSATNSQSKPSSQNASQLQRDQPVKPVPTPALPSRNVPAVPPRKDTESLPLSSANAVSRPPPIPKTSPNVPPAKKLSPSVVPRAVPPSPSPRPAPRTDTSTTERGQTDRPSPVAQRTLELPKETNSDKPSSVALPKPPAVPSVASEPHPRQRSLSGEETHANEIESEDLPLLSPPVLAESVTPQDSSEIKNLETHKPFRPTIIRVKKSNSAKTKVDSVNSRQGNIKIINQDVNPHLQQPEKEVNDSGNNQNDELLSAKSSDINVKKMENKTFESQAKDTSGPRSLKSGSILNSVKMFESQMQNEQSLPVEPKKDSVKPPVTAPKPKPAVLPKPGKTLISSTAESSDVSAALPRKSSAEHDADKETVGIVSERHQGDSPKVKQPTIDESKQTADESEVKRSSVQRTTRPTIIRGPPKPKRQISHDTDDTPDVISQNSKTEDSEQDTSAVSTVTRSERSVDDTEIKSRRPPPPLPNRRPASIAGVPQNFSLTEINLDKKSPSEICTSETQMPKKPKPAGRTRPVSLHISSDASHRDQTSQLPTGKSGPSVVGRPPPPKPQSLEPRSLQPRPEGPPPRPSPVARSRSSSSDIKPKPSVVPSGRLPQHADKPAIGSGDSEEDSSTERRPSRPKAGPMRPTSVPVKSRPEDRLEHKEADKPPRPVSAAVRKPSLPRPPSPARPQSISSPPLPKRPGAGHPLYHYMLSTPHGVALHDFEGSHPDDLSFKTGDTILLVKRVDDSWLRGKVGEKEGMFPQEFIQIVIPISEELLPSNLASAPPATNPWDDDDRYFEEADNISENKPDLIGHGPRCQARFDFEGGGDGDLQFEDGDYIRLLERVDDEWMKGEFNGRVGIFPLAFVEIIEDLPVEQSDMLLTSPESGYRSTSQENINDRHDTSSPGGISSVSHDHSSAVMFSDRDVSDFPSVMALYDFEADAPGDLPLKFGDYVKVFGCVNDEWLYGQCNGKEGQFPVQFIDEVPENLPHYVPGSGTKTVSKENTQTISPAPSIPGDATTDEPYCIAVHDFSGQTADDLSFKEGEIIQLLSHIGDDWLKGRLKGIEGIFPSNFVRIEKDCTASPQTTHNYAEASFDFEGQGNDELSFKKGDHILLGEMVAGAPDWQWGEVNGHRGIFPVAFVTVIES